MTPHWRYLGLFLTDDCAPRSKPIKQAMWCQSKYGKDNLVCFVNDDWLTEQLEQQQERSQGAIAVPCFAGILTTPCMRNF